MVWLLARDSDILICEVRREAEGYAIELAPSQGPKELRRYKSARELVEQYVHATRALREQGWKPATHVAATA